MPRAVLPIVYLSVLAGFLVACGVGADLVGPAPGAQTRVPAPRVLSLLRPAPYARLVLEIDVVGDLGPAPTNLAAVEDRLHALVDKPGGIEARLDDTVAAPAEGRVWSFPALAAYAAALFDDQAGEDAIGVHVLFVDGRYDSGQGGTVLGLAWSHRHIVIFQEALREACGTSALTEALRQRACADAELAVWMHELGHVLGLVDNGLVMQAPHEDDAHPGHDADANCVMYWAYEGDAVVRRAIDDLTGVGNAALDFCDHCLADLASARGD